MRRVMNRNILNQAASLGGNFSSLTAASRTTSAAAGRLPVDRLCHRWPIATASLLPSQSSLHQSNNAPLSFSSNFSTAAMPQESLQEPSSAAAAKPTKQKQQRSKRKPMRKRDPLIVTPTAAARIQFLLDQHNQNGGEAGNHAVGIQLGTKKRGCNGLSYTLNYAYENHLEKNSRDEAMTISLPSTDMSGDGLRVYVEPAALMSVIGTTMDFVDDEMSSEFTFTNPNSKGECGCGESFNV
ncbi:hypothetical protein ACHAXR_008751 [Thalassiosira sp. AJA248-18]